MHDENAELQLLTEQMYQVTGELIAREHKPFEIAAVYAMIAMQIYKTALNEEEYNLMVDAISLSRDKVKPLTEVGFGSVH